jgi:peptide/nickel transport system substrate-binding protein
MRFVLAFLLAALSLPAFAQPKNTVTLGLRLEPPGLDPTSQAASAVSEVTWLNIFEGLTRVDEQGKLLPNLATGWETSEDGRVWTFQLRDGVAFHDGAPLSSADVKFSFERNAAPNSTNKRKRIFANMASVEASDPRTVRITLKEPSRLLPFFLAEATAAIMSPASAEKNTNTPVGTGPYRFVRWLRGDQIALAKNAQHRNASHVAIQSASMRFIGDDNAMVAALLAGDIDYLTLLGATEMVERFKSDPRFAVIVGSTEGETFLGINNKREPFTDPRVRRAVNFAVDRKAVIDGAQNGFGKPIASHATTSNPFYVDLTSMYPRDLDKARALLKEAGFPDGFETTFKLPPQTYARRGGEILAAQLAEVGIRAKMEPLEWAQWLDVVFKQKNYGLTVIMQPEPWDIFNYADPNYFYNYDNATFRALMKDAESAKSDSEVKEKLAAAQRMLAEDAVNAWLYEFPKIAVAKKELAGIWRDAPMAVYELATLRWQ